ncbi:MULTISPECIES: TetR/AcrR family transcriptional regulator [Mycolicibacter]|uniref:TetR/AcrR family transcriptional regulator n=1 Tax=Mycolicibacter virginiensis TaxID=1795032 RepID=A0A9X7NXT7_9MYCO|nr:MULTISPECIES: TetR/AcrR family transcriptional regulator [Mycobacteriaceae]OBJ28486.1 TetR family transcriptional regulator [Mycolicibacter heraklionensis]PQM51311.1 TetR/AcrR family transcriptional regulator [Mycolicibacter virginiensis]ULP47701.1 TetR/AcrR family transcriptional regulator [Mycolicibacter virginiensis]
MGAVLSRQAYFETGFEVLSELGYGGLKLAEVCNRLGVTTGSFYHYFTSWPVYTRDLVQHWLDERTLQHVEFVRAIPDPRQRLDSLIQIGLTLPHGAEAAIRSWSSADARVHAVQAEVDQQRFDILFESAQEVLRDKRQAQLFANWAIYLLIGYEQALLPREASTFEWIAAQLLDALDCGRFATASDDPPGTSFTAS